MNLDRHDRARHAERPHDLGRHLPEVADHRAVDHDLCRTRRVQPGRAGRSQAEVRETERLPQRVDTVDHVVHVGRTIGLDGTPHDRAGQDDRQVVALVGQHLAPGRGAEHVTELEERDVGQAVRVVVRDRPQQPGQDARPQDRLLRPERVRGLDHVVSVDAERGEVGGRHQRQRERLRTAEAHQRVGHQPALPLTHGQAHPPTGRPGQRPRDLVVPDAPRDLLDEIDLAFEVGPEGRHDRVEPAVPGVELDAERFERRAHRRIVEVGAEQRVDARGAHRDARPADRRGVHVERALRRRRVRDLDEELHRAIGRRGHAVRVRPALEPGARLAAQAQAFRALRDPHGLEVRRLEQDLGGRVGDLRRAPPHDAGDRLRGAAGVADEEVLGGERALHAVERDHPLAFCGAAYDDAAAVEPAEVEGVERLAELEEHVVRDVDRVRDGPHPAQRQPARHPRRRRAHRHPSNAGEVARAALGVLDLDRDVGAGDPVERRRRRGRRRERQAEVRGEVARDADHRHGVGPVRRDRQVEHDVVEAEHGAQVGAELARRVERQDAGVVVRQVELPRRAQHAVGDHTPYLAPLQREAARQRRAHGSERHDHPDFDVRRAAHDARLAGPEVDVREAELVGVGVRDDVEDPGHDDAADLPARLLDGLDLQAQVVERLRDHARRHVERREVTDPGERCAHRSVGLVSSVGVSTGEGSGGRCRRTS
ncbi:MAG: hypothetical protein U0V73_08985 [Acidimicrobiia bacterium]